MYSYGKHSRRMVAKEHNAAHELMAATDRAKDRARQSGSESDWKDVKRAQRAEQEQIQRLIKGEKSVRNHK